MRDSHVIGMQAANAKRSELLFAQFEFLQTRQEAFERVLSTSTLSHRLKWALQPARFLRVVDAVQRVLIDRSRRALDEAREEAAKPKIELARTMP